MSKFDAAYTGKLYSLGETVDHDEAILHDLKSHLGGYLKWRPIDEDDTTEKVFYEFKDMLERVKPQLSRFLEPVGGPRGGDVMDTVWDHISDLLAEKGVRNKMDEGFGPDRDSRSDGVGYKDVKDLRGDDLGAEQEAEELRGPLPDEDSIQLSVGDFEKELTDLYWSVVETGVNENDARDWFDNVRKGLHELLVPEDRIK